MQTCSCRQFLLRNLELPPKFTDSSPDGHRQFARHRDIVTTLTTIGLHTIVFIQIYVANGLRGRALSIRAVVFDTLGTCALACLALYAWLAQHGHSRTLYSTVDHRICSARTRTFVALAAIAFFVCLFKGAQAMLAWLPSSLAGAGHGGESQLLADMIAGSVALLVGLSLAQVIDRATHNSFLLREMADEQTQLNALVDACLDDRSLEFLKDGLQKQIARFESKEARRSNLENIERPRAHLWPEGQRILRYHDIVGLIERQQQRLRQGRADREDDVRRADEIRRTQAEAQKSREKKYLEREAEAAWETEYLRTNPGARIIVRAGTVSDNGSFIATRELLSPTGEVIRSSRFGLLAG